MDLVIGTAYGQPAQPATTEHLKSRDASSPFMIYVTLSTRTHTREGKNNLCTNQASWLLLEEGLNHCGLVLDDQV